MKHNIKLMQGIKDRDHKAYKQKLRLAKYRKAYVQHTTYPLYIFTVFMDSLLRFFEQEPLSEASSSGGEDDLSDTSEDRKILQIKREKPLPARSPSPVDSVLSFTSPNGSAVDYEFDGLYNFLSRVCQRLILHGRPLSRRQCQQYQKEKD
jgi:hypothetical protein